MAVVGNTLASGADSPKDGVLVTTNRGDTWAARSLPSATSPDDVSCSSLKDCVLVGGFASAAHIATTSDSGKSWVRRRVPSGVTSLFAVSCPSTNVCVGVGDQDAASSSDGGLNWRTRLPQ